MSPIVAIAVIAVRAAVRSRVVLALLILLMIAVIGLPLSIRGDGTIAGDVRILLEYTLGAAFWILALTSLWAGCSAISHDIETRCLHLVLVKPVSRLQVWLGKWLGIVCLNGMLIAFCGVMTYLVIQWHQPDTLQTNPESSTVTEYLRTKRPLVIPAPDIEAEAVQIFAARQADGSIPDNIPDEVVRESIRQSLLLRENSMAPGETKIWILPYVRSDSGNRPMLLEFRFSTSSIGQESLKGRWSILDSAGREQWACVTNTLPNRSVRLSLPSSLSASSDELTLTYRLDEASDSTVVFSSTNPMRLLIPEDRFEANLLRALLVLLTHLCLLTAIGVTAGSLFSLPVASFAAIYALIIIQSGRVLETIANTDLSEGPWSAGSHALSLPHYLVALLVKGFHFITAPALMDSPLTPLASGILVSWQAVAISLIIKVGLYGGAMALFSSYVLNRREIGLPSS